MTARVHAVFGEAGPRETRTNVEHWCGPLDVADVDVLARACPPVLDIGCGPGRHVLALTESGKVALGIDITSPAVTFARRRGAPVLHRSVFARVPGAGRWSTVLLLDGNIGIGGDPVALLDRVRALLAPGGVVLVELEAPGCTTAVTTARLELDGVEGPWFPWAQVSVDEIAAVARDSHMVVVETWKRQGRWFAQLGASACETGIPSWGDRDAGVGGGA